jgi:hypothetical protein
MYEKMPDFTYSEKVSLLINLGEPETPWPDYVAVFGLAQDDIPELIRIAVDEHTWEEDPASASVYRNVHAWRALGQLRAVEAVPQLLGILRWVDDYQDDWAGEDLPEALGMMGPEAIPMLSLYLSNPQNKLWARATASNTLVNNPNGFPDSRSLCIAAISDTLQKFQENDDVLNSCLVADLADLKAVESSQLVERAFQAERVDKMTMGDWEDFQVEVGLLEKRITEPEYGWLPPAPKLDDLYVVEHRAAKKEDKKTKNKRKQEKASRKQNRKKKRYPWRKNSGRANTSPSSARAASLSLWCATAGPTCA